MINYSPSSKTGLCLLLMAFMTTGLTAQEIIRPNITNSSFLRANGRALLNQARAQRTEAFAAAGLRGWQTSRVFRDGTVMRLQRIDDQGFPVYYITNNNIIAAATTRTNKLYSGGGLGLSLSGSTITAGKVAIWDSDAVLASHIEFAGDRIEIRDNTSGTASHSTHVAGTMIAAGTNPIAKGMAFGLPKLYSFNFDDDTPEMSANAASLLISNHSYGTAAGWFLNTGETPQRWEFLGAPGATEDYKFGYYDTETAEWDKICYNAPYYLPVKSAGNNRTVNGPPVGTVYYRYNADRVMSNAGNRPAGISSNELYDNIATYGTAKNIFTVGAVNPVAIAPYTADKIIMTSFSSWGPTDDGRIKPDIVADGIRVTSTTNSGNSSYATLSGTSMATPNVSGSLILLQELYSQQQQNNFMRSATLKAVVINTAAEAGANEGPDYSYGWGLLDMEAAAKAILDNSSKSKILENILSQGEQQYVDVTAAGTMPLKATICWTDPEAVPLSTANGLNNTTLRLVNDLDLRINEGSTVHFPWVLNPASPATAASKGDNIRDNVEQVAISNPVEGTVYRLKISHKDVLRRGTQPYSIVITGINGQAVSGSNKPATTDGDLTLVVYPVPAKNEINYSFNVPEPLPVNISLVNLSGQTLYQENKPSFSGSYQNQTNITSYASGIYFIVVKAGSKTYTKKFICVK